jgi:RNA polymerase sigma-70 factor (ECF subfamily)
VPIKSNDLKEIYCELRQQLFTCALVITGVPALAEDAVQDAFCELLRSRSSPNDLKAYVFSAVRNSALRQFRRHPGSSERLTNVLFDVNPRAAEIAEEADLYRQVMELMKRLSEDERETIVQHLYADLTFIEIANVREVPLGTVVSWYRRGLAKLRSALEVSDGCH